MTDLAQRGPLGPKQPKPEKKPKGMRKQSRKKAEEKHPLRDNAKGKHCTLRLSGCCNDPSRTVFVHYRRFGWGGAGQKPNDLLGCFGCDICHEKQERYDPEATYENLLRAMGETLLIQLSDGKIHIES